MLENILITCTILSFVCLFAVVVYFRIKVLRAYGILVRNRVQFDIAHIFNKKRMEEEIIGKYPTHAKTIRDFALGIRLSMSMVTVFMILITLFAGALIYLN
jgi:hypothetical protein